MRVRAACLLITACVRALGAAPVPVMDLHSDLLLRAMNDGIDVVEGTESTHSSVRRLREGGVTDQVWAVWVDSEELASREATHRALQMIDMFQGQAARHGDDFVLARSVTRAREIEASGRTAVWLWLEGGAPIADDLALLRTFHRLGVAGMTLTWMSDLTWAGSSAVSPESQRGLTDFGREVVREMNRIGMVVDLSHVSDQTFWDVLAVTRDPVVLSHSDCRALSDHPRNVTDDMLRALARNGGVIGIGAYPGYLNADWEDATDVAEREVSPEIERLREELGRGNPAFRLARRRLIDAQLDPSERVTVDTFVSHILHAVEIAGPEHVALGSDFDGVWALPEGLENASRWQAVAEGLRARGLSEEAVAGIMRENARRVFEQVIGR